MTITATVLQGQANAHAQSAEIFLMYCLGGFFVLIGIALVAMVLKN